MGLLKRLFSIGSKKDKKKRLQIVHNVPLPDDHLHPTPAEVEDHEAAIGRLLRSSSARYAVVHEFNYASLPPLPHPINNVLQTPAASTVSLASSTISQRGTYTVTVHGRKRHASTEFPYANRDLEDIITKPQRHPQETPKKSEDSRVLRLRSDPSVASLLGLYDEHGRLPSQAFSNSPPKEGRAQCRRNGSTLRQLLGAPSSLTSRNANSSAMEGDISWAERFLGETDSMASTSSLGLPTPRTPEGDSHHPDITVSTDHDRSSIYNDPAISSMDVELSITSESSRMVDEPVAGHSPYKNCAPSTPRRASQVFGFLTNRRQSKNLPDPPSVFSSPSDDSSSQHGFTSHFSDTSADSPPDIPALPISRHSSRNSRRISTSSISQPMPLSRRRSRTESIISTTKPASNYEYDVDNTNSLDTVLDTDVQQVKVLMNGPTKVIVTAPTPSNLHNTPCRIPRGPRVLPKKKRSSDDVKPPRPMLTDRSISGNSNDGTSNDGLTHVLSRRKPPRSASQDSKISFNKKDVTSSIRSSEKASGNKHGGSLRSSGSLYSSGREKENKLALSVKTEIPMTPLRSNSSGANRSPLFRTAIHQGMFQPPTAMTPLPTTSSELSLVGKQTMDVRQQRQKAREADREKGIRHGRSGSGRSVIRF
ncbi:hypothetical protein BDQ12DRAFT_681379 [Crucibulum laeve]|uniref:Uncharacterized protein n=1 Tax=Crucibulum laeve TaxID=68775 RepID=A0A5C3M368_9AGAR|nr:hypothetical protein BDQ12DRAFT_681379 [Crucibulum laeve]